MNNLDKSCFQPGHGLPGCFITFEGGEGAGKSTQAKMLAEALRRGGHDVVLTREPGGSPGAETLRSLLLNGEHDWSPQAEALLHFAARAEHVARTIRPALERGAWVVCDRFYDSTMAYQGHAQGAGHSTISALTALLGMDPDLTLVMQASEDVAAARLAGRGGKADRYESLGRDFHLRVAVAFEQVAADNPMRCVRVDANSTPDEVHEQVMYLISARLMGNLAS